MAIDRDALRLAKSRVGDVLHADDRPYRLDRLVSFGGIATLYAATDGRAKRFAVKMLHPELRARADLQALLLSDARVANDVDHAGALPVLDGALGADGSAFVVHEWLDGETIEAQRLRARGRLTSEAVLAVGCQLLEVLSAAHRRRVLHRDINPRNVFVTDDGRLKVLNFGTARLRDVVMRRASPAARWLGTPAFMAPEQALGCSAFVDAQTDVWACGATLFTLLSGRPVHDAPTPQLVVLRAGTQAAPSLAHCAEGAPAPLIEVIDRALAFDKAARWPSADAMRDALRAASFAICRRVPSVAPAARGWGRPLPAVVPRVRPSRTRRASHLAPASTVAAVSPGSGRAPGAPGPRRVAALLAAVVVGVVVSLAMGAGRSFR